MRAIIAVLLLGFFSQQTYANQTLLTYWSIGNLHMEQRIDGSQLEQETKTKAWLLSRLADSLIRQQGYAAQPVLLRIAPAWKPGFRPAYTLSFGPFVYHPMWQQETQKTTGLQVILQGKDFDIQAALRLLLYGLTHQQYVQSHQTESLEIDQFRRHDNSPYSEFRLMLPQYLVAQVLTTPNDMVTQLLRQRIFCQARHREVLDHFTYYYQENAFHVFAKSARVTVSSPTAAPLIGPDLLVIDNVREVVGRATDGYFIFVSDSSFYYLWPTMRGAVGPVQLPRHLHEFQRVMRYTHVRHPVEQFQLTFVDNVSSRQLLGFAPGRYQPVAQPDQTTMGQQRHFTPAEGFSLLWLLLVGAGSLGLWWEYQRMQAARRNA